MATTANYALPYPSENDAPNGATQIGALALALDAKLAALMKKPIVVLVGLVDQSIPTNTITPVTFGSGTEIADTHGFHSTSSLTQRIQPNVAGWYRVSGSLLWQASEVGERRVWVAKNDQAQPTVDRDSNQQLGFSQSATRILSANGSTDYFTFLAWHTHGAALDIFGTDTDFRYARVFEVEFLRPL